MSWFIDEQVSINDLFRHYKMSLQHDEDEESEDECSEAEVSDATSSDGESTEEAEWSQLYGLKCAQRLLDNVCENDGWLDFSNVLALTGAQEELPKPPKRRRRAEEPYVQSLFQAWDFLKTCESALEGMRNAIYQTKYGFFERLQRAEPRGLLALPDDILSYIMEILCCTPSKDPTYYAEKDGGDPMAGFALSRVCQKFRRVALSSPRIWSRVRSLDNPAMVEVMLSRSKRVPLVVSFVDSYQKEYSHYDNLVKLIAHGDRWAELFIKGPARHVFSAFETNTDQSVGRVDLPLLKEMDLEGAGAAEWFIATCTFPALHKIRLADTSWLLLASRSMESLTSCSISVSSSDIYSPRGRDLLSLLDHLCSGAPSLQTFCLDLDLDRIAPQLPLEQWSQSRRKRFAELKRFIFTVHHCSGQFDLGRHPNGHLLMLFMDMPELEELKLRYRSYQFSHSNPAPPPVNELWHVSGQLGQEIGFLDALCVPGVKYTNLHEFSITYEGDHGGRRGERDIWLDILDKMPALKNLEIGGRNKDFFGKGWTPTDRQLLESFPPLRRLKIVEPQMSSDEIIQLHRALQGIRTWVGLEEIVIEYATRLQAINSPLEKVKLIDTSFATRFMADFKKKRSKGRH